MTGAPLNDDLVVRRARTSDVPAIKSLVDVYAGKILLEKNLVTLYEAVQEFWVAGWTTSWSAAGPCTCCGPISARYAPWQHTPDAGARRRARRRGAASRRGQELRLQRIFVLTFETEFFGSHGFQEIEGTPVTAEVYDEMRRSYDIGVAEFLDLSYVKPNILGNTRMLLTL